MGGGEVAESVSVTGLEGGEVEVERLGVHGIRDIAVGRLVRVLGHPYAAAAGVEASVVPLRAKLRCVSGSEVELLIRVRLGEGNCAMVRTGGRRLRCVGL
jgi:hypothetical protein